MKSFYFKDGIQVVVAVLLTGSMAYAMQPTTTEQPHSAPTVAIEQKTTKPIEKPAPGPQEKPAEAPKVEKAVTWQDNPQKCNQDTQFIAADAPFNCIDKPTQTTNRSAGAVATQSVPVSANSAKAFIYMKESGNNPGAINASSGACGLGQALPCSKMGCSLSDYACQDAFFTSYAMNRYGSWENAQAFWLANHWW
jgi:hypothetical protein